MWGIGQTKKYYLSMWRFIKVFIFLIVANTANAQQTRIIAGCAKDSSTKQPLPYCTIGIKTNVGIRYVKADLSGNFSVPATTDIRSIIISNAGYSQKEISININQPKLGDIYLVPSGSLETVLVRGKKPPVSFKLDRQVYKASEFASAAGGTAIDIVKNLPAISVDAQGGISFRGSSSFLVLVNGKPVQADAATVLAQISSSSIESIELITSPSVAYDADGKSGAINIVTKAYAEDGWLVQTNIMAGAPPVMDYNNIRKPQRYSFDMVLGYKKNKWDISGSVNYLRNDICGYREGSVYTLNENIKTAFSSVGERSFNRYNYGGRLALNYSFNSHNKFSSGFYVSKKYQSRDALLLYDVYKINNVNNDTLQQSSFYNPNIQIKQGIFTLANLGYEHIFSDKSKINFTALYEGANLSGNTNSTNFGGAAYKDTLQYTFNPNTNPLRAYRFKTDFEKQLANIQLIAGYQYRYETQDGDFLYYKKDPGDNQMVLVPEFTSLVFLKNHIHAAYLQASGNQRAYYYALGGRVETTQRSVSFSRNNEADKTNLIHFFPSAIVRYKPTTALTYKMGYSRRIRRTNNYELNPLPEREHSETLEQGDPYLLPELIGNFEFGIEKNIYKGAFFATLYHQRTKNPIQRVNKVYNDTILNRMFTNAGKALQTGLEMNINKTISPRWQLIFGGNIYYYNVSGKIFNGTIGIRNFAWVYSVNTTQSITLPCNWSAKVSINYISETVTAQGRDSRFLSPNLVIKKTSSDNRWQMQLSWLNIDAGMKQTNRQRITTWGDNFFTTTNYIYEPDQFQLTIGYSISRKNRKINLPQSEIGEKEF